MPLQNDSVTDGSEIGYFSAFRAGDIPAAVFEFPQGYDAFKIESIHILWAASGEAFDSFVDVHLYQAGLPVPVKLATLPEVPVQPGVLNEIRPGIEKGIDGALPGQTWVVHKAGGSFAVGVEYLTAWTDEDGPEGAVTDASGHQALDTDGCQPGRNLFYSASESRWVDPAEYGVQGDFVIRVAGKGFVSKGPFGDADRDRDVDQADFGLFQACFNPFGSVTPECEYFDFGVEQGDGKVDGADYDQFLACQTGPAIPADPQCGACLPVPLMRTQGSPGATPPGVFGITTHPSAAYPVPGSIDNDAYEVYLVLRAMYDPFVQDPPICRIEVVPHGVGVDTGILATTGASPDHGLDVIYIDNFYFPFWVASPQAAVLLYAQADHIRRVPNVDHEDMQRRLEDFRTRRGLTDIAPEFSHGYDEGWANP